MQPQLGLLKSTMLQLDSAFSERAYGSGSFSEFVEQAEEGRLHQRQRNRRPLHHRAEVRTRISRVSEAGRSDSDAARHAGNAPARGGGRRAGRSAARMGQGGESGLRSRSGTASRSSPSSSTSRRTRPWFASSPTKTRVSSCSSARSSIRRRRRHPRESSPKANTMRFSRLCRVSRQFSNPRRRPRLSRNRPSVRARPAPPNAPPGGDGNRAAKTTRKRTTTTTRKTPTEGMIERYLMPGAPNTTGPLLSRRPCRRLHLRFRHGPHRSGNQRVLVRRHQA